jgi:guanylate kinase
MERRLRRAQDGASGDPKYEYLIINDDIDDSIARLAAVVTAERLRVTRLGEEFKPWKT